MVMPRDIKVEFKKDGMPVFETTCTRGCLMDPDEFGSVLREAFGRYARKADDKAEWDSVTAGNREITREEFEKKYKSRGNLFGF